MSRRRACLLVLIVIGCVAEPVERPRAVTDKQAMFGDAGLLPTREGERARRELAIAGELEQALIGLGFSAARVSVELREPVEVVVIARLPTSDLPNPEATVAELSHALVPELAPERLHLWLQPAKTGEPESRSFDPSLWPLMLTCIGFGLALGVIGERLRSQW